MNINIFLIGVAISLAACSDAQIVSTDGAVSYHSNPALVRKVQIALRNRGYYHDLVDGYLGESTGIAIQRFQIDHSVRVIPLLDPSLLVSLGIQSNSNLSPVLIWAPCNDI
jgi:peptidoglycan hydrolase-like protein with peptidoglycan-binding domain